MASDGPCSAGIGSENTLNQNSITDLKHNIGRIYIMILYSKQDRQMDSVGNDNNLPALLEFET